MRTPKNLVPKTSWYVVIERGALRIKNLRINLFQSVLGIVVESAFIYT
jgi:hypothetical protein